MAEKTKACIACAEDIKAEALLCKHCKTRQDDAEFLSAPSSKTSAKKKSEQKLKAVTIDADLFVTAAATLRVLDDLDIFTFWKDDEVVDFTAYSLVHDDFFVDEDLSKLDAFLTELSGKGLAENEWSSIEEWEEEDADEQYKWHFESPLIEKLKDPKYLDSTLAKLKEDLDADRSFEDRANGLIVYCLERLKPLIGCKHLFKETKSLEQKCKKCSGVVFWADEYTELFG